MNNKQYKYTNALINETSPYLLQHAHNPVNWHPWTDDILEKAQKENKPIILSIGYSACHWCHVMEHESFENESIAALMNDNFICIKVDREERPDIDQIYMSAVQIMTGQGGWPLNCMLLPDGRPFWGGTYFPAPAWEKSLIQLTKVFNDNIDEVIEYAIKLSEGIKQAEIIPKQKIESDFSMDTLDRMVVLWKNNFDLEDGGFGGAPKFPMPSSLSFLLEYSFLNNDKQVQAFVNTTLHNIALGGIYDHVGGGFARYSTDKIWKVPHFEKMLYDNAQLISLYSNAYTLSKDTLFKSVVTQTLDFIQREMTSSEGLFYAGLDADSEGEEGKFYIWDQQELESIIGSDYELFAAYYNINEYGYWEDNDDGIRKYILLRRQNESKIYKEFEIDQQSLEKKTISWRASLLEERSHRIRPSLDNKHLISWNGLMSRAYIDAYLAFGNQEFLDCAVKNAEFIVNNCMNDNGMLLHSYNTTVIFTQSIEGFLEDYAMVTDAFIRLYEATFNEKWLRQAEQLTIYAIENFFDNQSGMFYFTSKKSKELIVKKMEIYDNVIPSSNSIMAKNLFLLGTLLNKDNYIQISKQMLSNTIIQMEKYTSAFSNYASLLLKINLPFYEVAIVGDKAQQLCSELNKTYFPNKITIGTNQNSSLNLLQDKFVKNQTFIYVCNNKVCDLPTLEIESAIEQMIN